MSCGGGGCAGNWDGVLLDCADRERATFECILCRSWSCFAYLLPVLHKLLIYFLEAVIDTGGGS